MRSSLIMQGKNTQGNLGPSRSKRRYKSKSKGAAVLPDDLASSVDSPVSGQNQKERVSADAIVDIPGWAELRTGFRDIVEPTLKRPGAVNGNDGTIDPVIEGNALTGSLVTLSHQCRSFHTFATYERRDAI